MYPTPAHDPVTQKQVRRAIEQLYERATAVFGHLPEATIETATGWYVGALRGELPEENPEEVARQIRDAVMDRADIQLSPWWGTPLGLTLLWYGVAPCDEHGAVPTAVVMEALGCTRQNVGKLYRRHSMRHPGRPYDNEALRIAVRDRWELRRIGRAA